MYDLQANYPFLLDKRKRDRNWYVTWTDIPMVSERSNISARILYLLKRICFQATRCVVEVLSKALSKASAPPVHPQCRDFLRAGTLAVACFCFVCLCYRNDRFSYIIAVSVLKRVYIRLQRFERALTHTVYDCKHSYSVSYTFTMQIILSKIRKAKWGKKHIIDIPSKTRLGWASNECPGTRASNIGSRY